MNLRHSQTSTSLSMIASLILSAFIATAANAQVAIYRFEFDEDDNQGLPQINDQFYQDGYLVLPAAGGSGSTVLLYQDGFEKSFQRSSNSVDFFTTIDDRQRTFGTIRGSNTAGSSASLMVAAGRVDSSWLVRRLDDFSETRARVPTVMRGRLIGVSDESSSAPAEDGTSGAVLFRTFELHLQKNRTAEANRSTSSTVSSALADLLTSLEDNGFQQEGTADPSTPDSEDDGETPSSGDIPGAGDTPTDQPDVPDTPTEEEGEGEEGGGDEEEAPEADVPVTDDTSDNPSMGTSTGDGATTP